MLNSAELQKKQIMGKYKWRFPKDFPVFRGLRNVMYRPPAGDAPESWVPGQTAHWPVGDAPTGDGNAMSYIQNRNQAIMDATRGSAATTAGAIPAPTQNFNLWEWLAQQFMGGSRPTGDAPEDWRIGDGNTENVPRYNGQAGISDNLQAIQNQAAAQAASHRLQAAALAEQRRQFDIRAAMERDAINKQNQTPNPWEMFGNMVENNKYQLKDGKTMLKQEPRQLINQAKSVLGLDVVQLAKDGDPRAIGALRNLYPWHSNKLPENGLVGQKGTFVNWVDNYWAGRYPGGEKAAEKRDAAPGPMTQGMQFSSMVGQTLPWVISPGITSAVAPPLYLWQNYGPQISKWWNSPTGSR
jgi:hypothetical protein